MTVPNIGSRLYVPMQVVSLQSWGGSFNTFRAAGAPSAFRGRWLLS